MRINQKENASSFFSYALHLIAWIGVFILLELSIQLPLDLLPVALHLKLLMTVLIAIPLYYLNTRILVPKLLFENRLTWYAIAIVTLIIVAHQCHVAISRILDFDSVLDQLQIVADKYYKHSLREGYTKEVERDEVIPAILSIVVLFIGGISTLSKRHFRKEKEQEEILKEKMRSELAFLRTQINPHFFFNTMNGIYSLIGSDQDLAKENVHHLSKMMRYVLYGSNKEKVTVNEEIEFLTNFIQLMEMRTHSSTEVSFKIAQNINTEGQIAPLLLIPFVENAFKHGVSYSEPSLIDIKLGQEDDNLTLSVSNHVRDKKAMEAEGGVGLANVNKRLELIYEDNEYQLIIELENGMHIVELSIPIA